MPNNKNFLRRIRFLDRQLQGGTPKSIVAIMEAYNRGRQDDEKVTSKNTFLADLDEIKVRHNGAIVTHGRGKNTRYSYEDPNFSVFNLPLRDSELVQLTETLKMLSQYQGLPSMDWLDDIVERFELADKIDLNAAKLVSFEHNPYLTGIEHYRPLSEAAYHKRALSITYKPFSGEPKTFTFHPYLLKQYNRRWFVLGHTEGYEALSNYALDRIEKVETSSAAYIENESVNLDDYYDDMVGVTRRKGQEPEEMTLWIDANTTPFVETKPIHGSQRMYKNEDGSSIVTLHVIDNYELQQLILSYTPHVKVLSPELLKQSIAEKLRSAANYYNPATENTKI